MTNTEETEKDAQVDIRSSNEQSGFVRRTMLSNAKFEVEKFDGTNNFGIWQCEVLDLLFREGSNIALESMP